MARKYGAAKPGGRRSQRAELVGEAKRRMLYGGGGSVGTSSTYMQLRSRRILLRNSVSGRTVKVGCGSDNHNSAVHDSLCCSVDESSGSRSDVHGSVGLEEDRCSETETPVYGIHETTRFNEVKDEESAKPDENSVDTEKKSDPECCRRTSPTEENDKPKGPTEAELDEFFSAAEKQHRKKYEEKYNFNFLKEKPMEGRYEWVKLSQ